MFINSLVLIGSIVISYFTIALIMLIVQSLLRHLKSLDPVADSEEKVTQQVVKFFGGPMDASEQLVVKESIPSYYIHPYIPNDEDERKVIGHLGNQVFVQPNLAYYQQMTEDSFFYVRDITEEELQKSMLTGKLPSVESKE